MCLSRYIPISLISTSLSYDFISDVSFRNALNEILMPYWCFGKNQCDKELLLAVISKAIDCIIFLSVKNVSVKNWNVIYVNF